MSRFSAYSLGFEMSERTIIKMNKTFTIQEEMKLLSKPAHALSGRNLLDLYEFSLNIPWKKWLCYSSAQKFHLSDGLRSTVAISPSSADALLLLLTGAMARF